MTPDFVQASHATHNSTLVKRRPNEEPDFLTEGNEANEEGITKGVLSHLLGCVKK